MTTNWHGRGSRHARGYGAAWDRLRAQVLREEPLCRHCRAKGRVTEATTVDHIIPKAKHGTDELDNLQPLCRACHDAKSLADQGKRRTYGCDADGTPLDPDHPWSKE